MADQSNSESAVPPLTDAERARLRPGVDAAALEQWLVATNNELRVAVIATFATTVTNDDLRATMLAIGDNEEDLADDSELAAEAPGELHVPGPDAPPGALSYRAVPGPAQPVVMMMPPEDPALALLWRAIEPSSFHQ